MAHKKHSATYPVVLPKDTNLELFFPQSTDGIAEDSIHNLSLAFPLCPNPSKESLQNGKVKRVKITIEVLD